MLGTKIIDERILRQHRRLGNKLIKTVAEIIKRKITFNVIRYLIKTPCSFFLYHIKKIIRINQQRALRVG